MVQLTDNTVRVYGADNFPGSVLAAVGVDRPAAQRFTDKPYIEIGITDEDMETRRTSRPPTATSSTCRSTRRRPSSGRATVFESDAWRKLSANRDNRVFAVNNEVWQTGEGIVAARGILADLRWVNAPIN